MNYKKQLVSDSRARAVSFGTGNPKKFITVHQTGNPSRGANAQVHANLQSRGFSASWHWQVDDKEAIQSFDHTWRLFHAGDGRGKGNMESIGIESCINSDGDYVKAVRNTAKLVAKIMKDEGIPISRVVQHNYWSGKNCPMQIRAGQAGITWNKFIQMVKEDLDKLSDKPASKPAQSSPTYYNYPPGTYQVLNAINTYDKADGQANGKLAKGARVKAVKELRSGVNGVWLQLDDGRYIQAQEWRTVNVKKIAAKPTPAKKSIDEMAQEVIDNKHGNYPERKTKLEALGYNYQTVQNRVNEILLGTTTAKSPPKTEKTFGTWRFNTAIRVRSQANTNSKTVAVYQAGQTVHLDGTLVNAGYVWGTYIGGSGRRRYVALRPVGQDAYGSWV